MNAQQLHQKCEKDCCAMLCIGFVFIAMLSTDIAALVIQQNYGDDACIGSYRGISFNYATWLLVYGVVGLVYGILSFCTLAIDMANNTNGLFTCYVSVFFIPVALFRFAWFVVGTV